MARLQVRHLGRVPYAEAYDLQRGLLGSGMDHVLILEHPATITLGRRADPANIIGDPAAAGAVVIPTDRGGDVTAHGPGQVVAYAIVSLDDDLAAIPGHAHRMEDAVITTVGTFVDAASVGGIGRLDGHPGVWVGIDTATPAKVSALGIRTEIVDGVRRTLHGVSLNVDIDLGLFETIVPCGISGRPVTSLRSLGSSATTAEVGEVLARSLTEVLAPGTEAEVASVLAVAGEVEPLIPRGSMLDRRLRAAGVEPDDGLPIGARKPEWLRIPVRRDRSFDSTRSVIGDLDLVTVCEEAGCPNIFECWADGTATFMVNGDRCTRACAFCLIDTRKPLPLDATEPERVAEAVSRMGLAHAVVTCVARDDLPDGGAGAIADTIRAIRARCPETKVEVLISDLRGDLEDLELILEARPDVLNHNIETVARLQRAVRPSAGYARSLTVLARSRAAGLVTKSGIMVGLGEDDDEVVTTLRDLAAVGVQLVTIGQYLRPTADHAPIARHVDPATFSWLAAQGQAMGLTHVQSSPLTRSSYHARDAADSAAPVELRRSPVPG
jgi:lipoic acid synthetase